MVTTRKQTILGHIYNNETAEECQDYARLIGDLLASRVNYYDPELDVGTKVQLPHDEWSDYGLVVCNDPPQSRLKRWLFGSSIRQAERQASTSLLLARQPRWPIQNVLLILRSNLGDETAVHWVQQLVQTNRANVTILPIAPPIPLLYQHGNQAHLGLDVWAAVENSLQTDLGKFACWLISQHTTATVRVRLGSPNWQIRQEISEGDYDLVVLGAEPYGRFSNWLFGELVGPLLDWVDRPVLVTRLSR